jgi:Outer membrane lipoprotein carrier protein LolA-like
MGNLLPSIKMSDGCAKALVTPARIIDAIFCAAIAGSLLATQTALAAEWGIAQLMQGLAQRGAERSLFVEKKFIAILDRPLESSGELRYVPPDRLEKRTFKPKPESLVLDRDTLAIERGNQKHALRLQDHPEVAAFVESLRGTLAGDRKALERVYRLELHGNEERWTLVMYPSDAKLAAMVLRIDVTGTRDRVRSIEILQADGDRSVMTVEPIAGAASATRPVPQ